MSFQKKVMILCDTKNSEGCGILRFTMDGNNLYVNVKMQQKNIADALLLIKINGKIFNFNINQNDTVNLGNTPLSNTVQCLVLDKEKPLYYSTTSADKYTCFNLYNDYKRQNSNIQKLQINNNNGNILEDNLKINNDNLKDNLKENDNSKDAADKQIDEKEQILSNENEDNKKNNNNVQNQSTSGVLDNSVEYNGENYYLAVKPQLDEMFICYVKDETLNNLVPNSRWVKVDNDDEYYSVGIIYELDEPIYIAYAISGIRTIAPPDNIKDLCSWLPKDLNKPNEDGYYVLYQDAKNGKTLKTENNRF